MVNIRDGSAIYGSNDEKLHKVRTFKDGKLKLSSDGLLLHDKDGIAVSGDVRNSWIGVSTLQALFVKEHNAVCDTLKVTWYFMTQKGKCGSITCFGDLISLACECLSLFKLIVKLKTTSFFMMF